MGESVCCIQGFFLWNVGFLLIWCLISDYFLDLASSKENIIYLLNVRLFAHSHSCSHSSRYI